MLAAWIFSLLGFALLALSQQRHLDRVAESNEHPARAIWAQRGAGFIAIGLGLPVCIASQGASFGSLLWGMLMSAAAMTVALTLTWRPRWLRPLARAAQIIFQNTASPTSLRHTRFQTLLIALHEGRETLLVAAIAMLYLLCAIRTELAMAMGHVLSRVGAISPTVEGVMALLATAAVTPCVVRDAHDEGRQDPAPQNQRPT